MQVRQLGLGAVLATLLLALAGAAYLRWGRAAPVPIATAAPGRVALQVVGPGTVQARVPVALASRITAQVVRIDPEIGDTVQRGQVLAWLESSDLAARRSALDGQAAALARHTQAAEAAVAKAHADLALAQSRQRRDAELLRTGFLSPAALDTSDATLAAAAANLDSARASLSARQADALTLRDEARYAEAQLAYTRISTPTAGMVIARQVEVGSVVVPGAPLLKIVDPAGLWVATRVDESLLPRVRLGQPAQIRLRSGEVATGRVARIARQSDAATRELEVDVAFDQPPRHFAIDQEAQVRIAAGESEGLAVPLAALVRDAAGRQGLWVVDGSERARFRAVQTGPSDEQRVLITAGLAVGERYALRAERLRAGQRVRALADGPAVASAAPAR